MSGGYGTQQGIDRSTDRRRTSVMAKLSQQVNPRLDVDVSGNFVQTHSNFIPEGEQTQGVITSIIFTPTSFKPFFDPNQGRYPYNPLLGANPLDVLHNWEAPEDVTRLIGTFQGTFRPAARVTLRYLVGIDDYRQEDKYLQPPLSTSATFTGRIDNPIRVSRKINSDFTATHTAQVSPSFGLTSTLGLRYTSDHADVVSAAATDLPPEQTTVGGATQFASQGITELRTLGGYLEERVSLRDRLFLTGGVNLEGASAFGPDERWQVYPRLSGSWLLHEEPFWRRSGIGRRISSLRLRAAYGQTGGQPPSAYSQFQNYLNASFGGKPGLIASNTTGNPNLRPERQRAIEGGVDLGLFQDRAQLELTYYHQRTSDLVLSVPLAPSIGALNQFENVGVLRNKGWEAALNTVNVNTASIPSSRASASRTRWRCRAGRRTRCPATSSSGAARSSAIRTPS